VVADLLLEDKLLKQRKRLNRSTVKRVMFLQEIVFELFDEGVEWITFPPINVRVILGRSDSVPRVIGSWNPDNNRSPSNQNTRTPNIRSQERNILNTERHLSNINTAQARQAILKDADEVRVRRGHQETPKIASMHINRRKNIREREELVTPPVVKTLIYRILQKAIEKALKLMMIPQIVNTITKSPELDKNPHEPEPTHP